MKNVKNKSNKKDHICQQVLSSICSIILQTGYHANKIYLIIINFFGIFRNIILLLLLIFSRNLKKNFRIKNTYLDLK